MAASLLCAACDRTASTTASSASAPKPAENGVASFYSPDLAGRTTASGEPLKLDAMTAASRTLPLGTRVQVVNLETGQSAMVRINDRGPYAKGRVIDLTPNAARRIGLDRDDGVAHVKVKPIKAAKPPMP